MACSKLIGRMFADTRRRATNANILILLVADTIATEDLPNFDNC